MIPNTKEIFTPEEAGTISSIKKNILQDPELNQVLQNIVDIFTKIRSKIAKAEKKGTTTSISISVTPFDKLIRLHEGISETRGALMKAIAYFTKSPSAHSQDLIFSTKGFLHKKGDEKTSHRSPQKNRAECLKLLNYFYKKIQEIASQMPSES